jgi:hypothetical protein
MATHPISNFYSPSSLTFDTHTINYFEEDYSILEDLILDPSVPHSGLEMPESINSSRQNSYDIPSELFSPKTDDWQQPMAPNNPFIEQTHNPFLQMDL